MPQVGVRARGGEVMPLLGCMEHAPGGRQEDEASGDRDIAQEVQGVQVRVASPAEQGLPEVAGIVREDVQACCSSRT